MTTKTCTITKRNPAILCNGVLWQLDNKIVEQDAETQLTYNTEIYLKITEAFTQMSSNHGDIFLDMVCLWDIRVYVKRIPNENPENYNILAVF